jgi:hypothetical protein
VDITSLKQLIRSLGRTKRSVLAALVTSSLAAR